LEEVKEADMLILVADGSSPVLDEEIATVNSVLRELEAHRKPTILAINKIDKCGQNAYLKGYDREKIVEISALKGLNLDILLKTICEVLPSSRQFAQLFIPYDEGQALDEIHQHGLLSEIEYKESGIKVKGRIEKAVLKKYEEYAIEQ
jgi:GTP-binding protein HflX